MTILLYMYLELKSEVSGGNVSRRKTFSTVCGAGNTWTSHGTICSGDRGPFTPSQRERENDNIFLIPHYEYSKSEIFNILAALISCSLAFRRSPKGKCNSSTLTYVNTCLFLCLICCLNVFSCKSCYLLDINRTGCRLQRPPRCNEQIALHQNR